MCSLVKSAAVKAAVPAAGEEAEPVGEEEAEPEVAGPEGEPEPEEPEPEGEPETAPLGAWLSRITKQV